MPTTELAATADHRLHEVLALLDQRVAVLIAAIAEAVRHRDHTDPTEGKNGAGATLKAGPADQESSTCTHTWFNRVQGIDSFNPTEKATNLFVFQATNLTVEPGDQPVRQLI